ncbi:hypothetical protein CAOG_06243 [Capsaspora owczarzaki ATCC 30864]|uniref:RGS domain-containing protein n=1 Tax=Capsaspora owczarzaki (strain ATCC 30864) TaxID=595528 RepID=A0A0D2X4C9_CAPO3|nr:hypothetical protein CAOG_06243 [Capsaspora owczarzaki ATCC 30864]KJE95839.1 hypothetical protein CAOG_006243 [Capsaspora owczarzaki ATCC 30864]|eukprot:XP_004344992.1 hypothetical protein CAOG_06243 [Capsaspora owczarzaki ATCC 30864]
MVLTPTTVQLEFLLFAVIYAGLFLVLFPLFLYRSTREPLRSRGVFWSIFTAIGLSIDLILLLVRSYDRSLFSCRTRLISAAFISPLSFLPYFIRSFVLWYRLRWHQEKSTLRHWFHDHRAVLKLRWQILFWVGVCLLHIIVDVIITESNAGYIDVNMTDTRCNSVPNSLGQNIIGFGYALCVIALVKLLWRDVEDAYYVKSELRLLAYISIPTFIVYFALSVVDPKSFDYGNMLIIVFLCIFIANVCFPIVVSYYDEIVQRKMARSSSQESLVSADLPRFRESKRQRRAAASAAAARQAGASSETDPVEQETIQVDEDIDSDSESHPEEEQQHADANPRSILELDAHMMSSNLALNQLGTTTRPERPFGSTLSDILGNDILMAAFADYTVRCWCSENLLFYRTMTDLRARQQAGEKITAEDIQAIRREYLLPTSKRELNLPITLSAQVNAELDREPTDPAVLDPVFKSIFALLKTDVYPRFRQSSLFQEALARVKSQSQV